MPFLCLTFDGSVTQDRSPRWSDRSPQIGDQKSSDQPLEITKLNGSVARSPGSVTGGIAKVKQTKPTIPDRSPLTNLQTCMLASTSAKSIIYVARMLLPRMPTHGETNQPHRIGLQRGLAKEIKTLYRIGRQGRSPERSSEGKENKPNQPYRIRRQDRSPDRCSKGRKQSQP